MTNPVSPPSSLTRYTPTLLSVPPGVLLAIQTLSFVASTVRILPLVPDFFPPSPVTPLAAFETAVVVVSTTEFTKLPRTDRAVEGEEGERGVDEDDDEVG